MIGAKRAIAPTVMGIALSTALATIAFAAAPTSAWFSDTSTLPLTVSIGEIEPEPDPMPSIPWGDQGREHAEVACEGTATWHFVLTGDLVDVEAELTVTFADAGNVGPISMQPQGKASKGARHAWVELPAGDVALEAVAMISPEPAPSTLLVLSGSTCDDDETAEDGEGRSGQAPGHRGTTEVPPPLGPIDGSEGGSSGGLDTSDGNDDRTRDDGAVKGPLSGNQSSGGDDHGDSADHGHPDDGASDESVLPEETDPDDRSDGPVATTDHEDHGAPAPTETDESEDRVGSDDTSTDE